MPPTDDEQLCGVVGEVVAGLIAAHKTGDVERVAAEIGKLLVAVARYSNPERRRDQALGRALTLT